MKKEKVVLSFIAALIGLLVASVAFYFYQGSKTAPQQKAKIITATVTPATQTGKLFLTVDQPRDEEVVNKKTITISGKTVSEGTVVIITTTDEQVITPAGNGDFSTTVTIDDGENPIEITAIGQNGQESTINRTVTFSTETF